MKPGSRTFLCWQDGLTDTGEIKPVNPACKAAQQVSGTTPFYNWFSVLRSDGAGRTRGFVPDGELCSGGNPKRQRDLQRPGRDGAQRRLERCVGSREERDVRVRRLGIRR